MGHVIRVEALQEDGRTLEITPVGGIRVSAPVIPRGEILELAGQDYVVVALRQTLAGWGSDWDAVTTYLVDEAEDDPEYVPVVPSDGRFSEMVERQ